MKKLTPLAAALFGLSAQALAQPESSVELDSIAISSTHQEERADGPVEGYRAKRSASATRTDAKIEDIPQAISVVSKDVLEDLGSTRMERALDFAGGASHGNNFGGLQMGSYNLRGFNTAEIYRNGFSINRGFISPSDASNLERVEVLKGPASSLFGRGDPGGLVNMVTKRPQNETFNEVKVSAGRWDKYRSTLDVNRPLSDDGKLLARVNVALEDNGSFRDHVGNQRQVISPDVLWQLGEDTTLFIDAEFSRTDIVFDRGVPAVNNKVGKVKNSNFLGEPNDGKNRTDSQILHVSLEHQLSESWKARLAAQYLHADLKGAATESNGAPNNAGVINRYLRMRDDFNAQDIAVHAELLGKLQLLAMQHEVLAGVEYENYHNRYAIRYSNNANNYPINIHNPIHGTPKPPLTGNQTYDRDYTTNYALNLNDQIAFNEQWSALLGVRIERFEQDMLNTTFCPAANSCALGGGNFRPAGTRFSSKRSQSNDVAIPRAGLVYKWMPEVALFASVGSSFKPNGSNGAGGALKPEKGFGYESGIKLDLLESRLGATLAAFYIEKKNLSQQDLTDPNGARRIAAGEARSQGFDMQLSGQLTDGLRVLGSYAFIDAKLTKDNRKGYKGARLDNTPRHSGSLLAVYQFQGGAWQGSDMGAAVTYFGERLTSTGGTPLSMPAYATLDLLGHWQATADLTLGVNLNNLFDRQYVERSLNNVWYLPGEPRNLNLSATLTF